MIRRIATSLFVVAAVVAMACIDMSAPKGRPASISSLLLPSPSVVVGDSMRDSAGKVAPLRIIAYDANNAPIPSLEVLFFVTDSAAVAHISNVEDHHPDIECGWGYCRIRYQTHSIGGLHENDFICAAKIDALG